MGSTVNGLLLLVAGIFLYVGFVALLVIGCNEIAKYLVELDDTKSKLPKAKISKKKRHKS